VRTGVKRAEKGLRRRVPIAIIYYIFFAEKRVEENI
jgi:hypothetical protein